ncbi:hypothetical protein HanIR_Chr03g0143801 [Helianthus annuus]|nr:hypothetical protein HanIR_Chr03g0143801 [Helianthus annuus]
MRLLVGKSTVNVIASGAFDVDHKDELFDGKVSCSLFWGLGMYQSPINMSSSS